MVLNMALKKRLCFGGTAARLFDNSVKPIVLGSGHDADLIHQVGYGGGIRIGFLMVFQKEAHLF